MTIHSFKTYLEKVEEISFYQPDGKKIPDHFHITEAGLTTRHFLDCGGSERREQTITMQLWSSSDTGHRLKPATVLKILEKIEPLTGSKDFDIEIEYQSDTIGRYDVNFDGDSFQLKNKYTDCPAPTACKPALPRSSNKLHCTEPSCC